MEFRLPLPAWVVLNSLKDFDNAFAYRDLPDGKRAVLIFSDEELASRFTEIDGDYGDEATEVDDARKFAEILLFLIGKGVQFAVFNPTPRSVGTNAGCRPIMDVIRGCDETR